MKVYKKNIYNTAGILRNMKLYFMIMLWLYFAVSHYLHLTLKLLTKPCFYTTDIKFNIEADTRTINDVII